ncbi:uncharacterized protein F37A4.5-like [Dendrobium catenatum]|uniref:COP9 signalosome complex subunit 5b n=1 Tax=Dendrobium catenatum TaxID=906689 RepID=A0A2I0X8F1_9ASPA|nr:uncharacterized protein F37A4.5-like [Dendrobium catenatum]PKU84198.1 COP9 signalosome complex subunit 5b [Dendrobium catenatum]
MPLTSVQVSEDVWLTCLAHSLTTETEEIMGLLFGDIQDLNNGNKTALIWGASPQMRSDRRKDRVETNPEQLAAASAQAEKLSQTIGRTTRVIGWYHSHPHITVLPSHVDVRTQAMYQMLDRGFIGLIFSCFSEDAQKVGRIQVIAFQSADLKQRYESPARDATVDIETSSSWSSFDNPRSASESPVIESIEQDSGDSRMTKTAKIGRSSDMEQFCTHNDIKYLEKQKMAESSIVVFNAENLHETSTNTDSIDMSDSVQEALHRSSMDISGAEYIRMEVPLIVLPTRALLKLDSPLSSFTDMQHMLFEEEQSAYKQALLQNMRNGKIHPLAYIHHTSTYQASLCKLIEYCLSPAVKVLQDRLKENEIRLGILMEEGISLERELNLESSPRRHQGGALTLQREMRSSGESGSRSPSGISNRRKTP